MQFKDYYATLGVDPTANADEIKRAYRKLARKFHPDVSKEKDATEKFQELGEAYDVLGDAKKRAAYDDFKAQRNRRATRPSSANGAPDYNTGFDEGLDFSTFFESIFGDRSADFARPQRHRGGAHHSPRQSKGDDLRAQLALTLEEAYAGTTQTIELRSTSSPFDSTPEAVRTLRVKIPAGVIDGQEIRLKGQGGAGTNGGPAGHLLVQIKIAAHPHFTLDGKHVLLRVPLLPWEAALGARIRVPTLAGAVDVNVPAGQSDSSRLRLKARGMPGEPAGDQFLVFSIVVPTPASDAQRALYQQLAELPHDNVRSALAGE